jgi:hypothetical protein
MKRSALTTAVLMVTLLLLAGSPVIGQAAEKWEVTVTNLTRGQVVTPPLVISHAKAFNLFKAGRPASSQLAALAEDGDTSPMETLLNTLPSVKDFMKAAGPIPPGDSATVMIKTSGNKRYLSVAGMLADTNDAFFAVQDVKVPGGQSRRVYSVAYDAGSEANSESCTYIPGPTCGNAFVRDTAGAEGKVLVHAGIHGTGDLMPETHDWRNPVVRITIKKMK